MHAQLITDRTHAYHTPAGAIGYKSRDLTDIHSTVYRFPSSRGPVKGAAYCVFVPTGTHTHRLQPRETADSKNEALIM